MKAYTDLKQSRKLAEFLPLESADMWYQHIGWKHLDDNFEVPIYIPMIIRDCESDKDIPCWSFAALFNLCPTINGKQPILTRGKLTRLWYCYYEDEIDTQTYDNPIDACYEMIIILKEKNLL